MEVEEADRIRIQARLERALTRRNGYVMGSLVSVLVLWVLEYVLVWMSIQRTAELAPVLPIVAGAVLRDSVQRLGFFGAILLLWGLTLVFVPLLLMGWNGLKIRGLRRSFQANEEEIQAAYALAPPREFSGYLSRELTRLANKTARVLLDNEARCIQATQWRQEAQRYIETGELMEAQSSLNSLNELVLREENELREQRNWRLLSIAIMAAYMFLLILATVALRQEPPLALVPIFGIPYRIIMWAGLGSLGAILYRFYTERERVRFDLEVRWLIARPVIGIIMGGLAYLALTAGMLLVLNDTEAASTAAANAAQSPAGAQGPPGRFEVYLIIAFLAGFSDKFYERIIDLLVGKTLGSSELEARNQPGRIRRSGGPAPRLARHAPAERGRPLTPQVPAVTSEKPLTEAPPAPSEPLH